MAEMVIAESNNDKEEVSPPSDVAEQDEKAKLEMRKNGRERLRELRRANSKYPLLINASVEELKEMAHDRYDDSDVC